ncbi:MAG: DUF305 domain-containing protein [Candidatus Daviesbacteria bacterium]|nr:DUF305 domain-containing protein [Candidatus Daviesbacteria bacterium]
MSNREFLFAVGGFLIGVVIVWLIAQSAVNNNNPGMMGMMGLRSQSQQMRAIDAHFIEQMIPHHEDAITMSRLALQKSNRQEIKTLAQNIIDSQTKEIDQMKSWYKGWYNKEVPSRNQAMMRNGRGGGFMGMMGDETDIEELENATDFDKAFIEEMIPHHQMAVMMSSMLKRGTSRPEMEQLADDIITSQSKEISQMRQWYGDWGY